MNYVTPLGFRDILPAEAQLREDLIYNVQKCFASRGYEPVETPTLEVLDVMAAGGRLPGVPFKFFDARGDLLAMRPDVTIQIARIAATRLNGVSEPLRLRYTQNVYREAESDLRAQSREMTQLGIECIGEQGPEADAEIIGLFAEALQLAGVKRFSMALAMVSVLRSLLDRSGGSQAWRDCIMEAFHTSNFVELDTLTDMGNPETLALAGGAAPAYMQAIAQLPRIRGGREAIDRVRDLVAPLGCTDGLDDLETTFDLLEQRGLGRFALIDFSVMSSFDYYTGVIFEAYAPGVGTPIGSGGRYDNMLAAYGLNRPAAGFAFYLEQAIAAAQLPCEGSASPDSAVAAADCADPAVAAADCATATADPEAPLRIAIPKGSLYPDTIRALEAAGLDTTGLDNPGRQLTITNPGVCYIIVRPTDAPTFVSMGAADCGICGKDSLLEADSDVVELVDLNYGGCRFVVAEPAGATPQVERTYQTRGSIRVATKYPNITRAFYASRGQQVEVVKLHGNIELAPLTGMAERIVDITATGTTLRENNLVIVDEVLSSTARFFGNTCTFRTDPRVVRLAQQLGTVCGQLFE